MQWYQQASCTKGPIAKVELTADEMRAVDEWCAKFGIRTPMPESTEDEKRALKASLEAAREATRMIDRSLWSDGPAPNKAYKTRGGWKAVCKSGSMFDHGPENMGLWGHSTEDGSEYKKGQICLDDGARPSGKDARLFDIIETWKD